MLRVVLARHVRLAVLAARLLRVRASSQRYYAGSLSRCLLVLMYAAKLDFTQERMKERKANETKRNERTHTS